MPFANSTFYGWMLIAGIIVSLLFWVRLARKDERLFVIYVGALVSAFIGAKLVYFAAEGWSQWNAPDRWRQWITGKSILGALLGGYCGVEIAKKLVGYRSATGDWFALIAPIGIMMGRIGCLMHGCCLGQICDPAWFTINDSASMARWPASIVEMLFNAAALIAFLTLRRKHLLPGQHFHIYLMAYGVFRFGHEFVRATPPLVGGLTGYQFAALLVAALGLVGFNRRRRRAKEMGTATADVEVSKKNSHSTARGV